MNRKSISFLVRKFYLPLGVLGLLIGFGVVVVLGCWEKEKQLSVLLKDLTYLQFDVQHAASLAAAPAMLQDSVKAEQFGNTISRIKSLIGPESIDAQLSAEWQKLTQTWEQFYGHNKSQFAEKAVQHKLANEKIILSFDALELICQDLSATLSSELTQVQLMGRLVLIATLSFGLASLLFIGYFMYQAVLKPMQQLEAQAEDLLHGKPTALQAKHTQLVDPLYKIMLQDAKSREYLAQAAEEIGDANFQQNEHALQQAGLLGSALLNLRQKMQAYFLAEQRRNWSSQGLEHFAKLLREQSLSVDGLCKTLMSELVPFVDANQGAIFTTEEETQAEEVLQLQASYAWGRHKYLEQTIYKGDGLIGQAFQDKDMLLITDVPENYITIGSGLGRTKPRCILILPLISNEILQGMIELASFRVFEAHETDFLKKLCESVAATLASLKSSSKTIELLEKANAANAHLQAQEEELRQNTEELMATQETMQKKDAELSGLFASIDYSLLTASFDLDGRLLTANDKFRSLLAAYGHEQQQPHCFQLLAVPGWLTEQQQQFMASLLAGQSQNMECQLASNTEIWISASFTPVLNNAGRVSKIMMLGSDISEKKHAELAFMAQTEEITLQEEKLRHYTAELEVLQASLADKLKAAHLEMEAQIREIALEREKNVAILEGCVDGVVTFNERGIIEFFNHAAEEIWAMPRQQVLGNNINNLISIEIQYKGATPQVYFSKGGNIKALDVRTEVPLFGATGEEIEALVTLTRVNIGNTYMFTAFVQKVAVELF